MVSGVRRECAMLNKSSRFLTASRTNYVERFNWYLFFSGHISITPRFSQQFRRLLLLRDLPDAVPARRMSRRPLQHCEHQLVDEPFLLVSFFAMTYRGHLGQTDFVPGLSHRIFGGYKKRE